jgi:hypothetical protein
LQSTRTALGEVTGRLRADEYDRHSIPTDLRMSFKILAEMARMMHLTGLDNDIEALARAFLDLVEPLPASLSDIAPGVQR